MEKAVDLLKRGRSVDILNTLEAVFSCITKPFESTEDEKIHRNLGDNLARLEGGQELTKFLQYLHEIYDSEPEREHVLYGITLIGKTCRNYSVSSSELCEQFGRSGLLMLMFSDIDGLNKEVQQIREPAGDLELAHTVWYHDMLPKAKATQLLQEDGDFLVRRNAHYAGQFVLSVKSDGTDKHILIKEQDQKYRFEGNGFTTVSDLIESYMNSGTSIKSSAQVLLKRPIVRRNISGGGTDVRSQLQQVMEDKTLAFMVWYHGCLTRIKANELLKDDGDFLVRRKEDGSGQFVLSAKLDGTDLHFVIKERDHKFFFSAAEFDSVSDLIEACVKGEHPIQVSSRKSSTVVLKSPVTVRRGVRARVANTDSCLQEAQRRWYLIMSAVVVLYHCAKVAQNRQTYKDLRAIERLSPILKSKDLTLAMGAMLILSEIVEDQDFSVLTADKHLISYTLSTLKATVTSPKLKGNMKAFAYSIADMSRAVGNISVNNKNKGLIVDLGGVPILVDLLNQNRPDIRESAVNTLWLLAHLERNKAVIAAAPGVISTLTSLKRSGNTAVMQAAKRALIKINPTSQESDEGVHSASSAEGRVKGDISGIDPNTISFAMRETVELLAKGSEVDIMIAVEVVYNTIIVPFTHTSDERLLQRFGDQLASLGGGHELTKLMKRLQEVGDRNPSEQTWSGITLLRDLCWNYSDKSLKLCKQFGQSGLLERMLKDIDRFGPTEVMNEKRLYLLRSAFGVLQNCARATENKQVYRDIRAIERIAPFMKSKDMSLAMGAMLTLSYVIEDHKIDLLAADEKLIAYTLDILKRALADPRLRGTAESGIYSALEITTGLGNIAVNNTNKDLIVKLGGVPLLIELLKKDRSDVQESAANTLWILAQADKHRGIISFVPGAINTLTSLCKSKITVVKQAGERALMKIKSRGQGQVLGGSEPTSASKGRCSYRELCGRFKESLGLPEAFFEPKFDMCYCTRCHNDRGDKLYYARGKPAKDYGVPIGWCRFALKTPPKALALDVFKKWHVAFHGTKLESVKPILETGEFLIPGDIRMGGAKLSECSGHFSDDRKPHGFDTKQIFLSPSIRYSGCDVYAPESDFFDKSTKKSHKARVVFQVCINPTSYKVGPQTIGVEFEIDPKFSNQEIEWFTKERGVVIIYGLLVKIE